MRKPPKFTANDLEFAFESAASFLELEEWPEDDGGAQVAAYREAAKRIRDIVARLTERRAKQEVRAQIKQTKKDLSLIADMRSRGTSNFEIAIAMGIQEDSPLLVK